MKNSTGIRQKILAAESTGKLKALLQEFNGYKNASPSTVNRVRRAGLLRADQLSKIEGKGK